MMGMVRGRPAGGAGGAREDLTTIQPGRRGLRGVRVGIGGPSRVWRDQARGVNGPQRVGTGERRMKRNEQGLGMGSAEAWRMQENTAQEQENEAAGFSCTKHLRGMLDIMALATAIVSRDIYEPVTRRNIRRTDLPSSTCAVHWGGW